MDIKALLQTLIALAGPLVPLIGDQSHEVIQRALTLPESKIRELCKGMSEEDTLEAIKLLRAGADKFSDAIVLIASRGTIDPD